MRSIAQIQAKLKGLEITLLCKPGRPWNIYKQFLGETCHKMSPSTLRKKFGNRNTDLSESLPE